MAMAKPFKRSQETVPPELRLYTCAGYLTHPLGFDVLI